jgi:hypothetical protein
VGARNGPHPLHHVRMGFNVLGKTCHNDYHVGEIVPGVVKMQHIDLAARFRDWWNGGMFGPIAPSNLLGYDATLLQIYVEVAALILEDPIIGDILDLIGIGLSESRCLPNSISYAVEWTTGYSGRAMHGRTFVVGMALDALQGGDENRLTDGRVTEYEYAYGSLIEAVKTWTDPPGGLCLALKHHAPVFSPPSFDPWGHEITGARMPKKVIGSQRLRLPHDG